MDLSNLPFPEPPDRCNDPELWTWLAQFEFVRWMRDDYESDYNRIRATLVREINRVLAALDEEEPVFRWRAAHFAVALHREQRVDLILRVLRDPDPYVRAQLASHLISIAHPQIEARLLELVTMDPVPEVRGAACRGLAGQNPLSVIPILIRVMDTDHAPDHNAHRVSDCAANALDEMIGAEFMAKRFTGVASLPDGPPNPGAVREHALAYLDQLRSDNRK
jgi:hypothetical protein